MSKLCNHKSKAGLECGLEVGHIQNHRCNVYPAIGDSSNFIFKMYEWRDNGEDMLSCDTEYGSEFPVNYSNPIEDKRKYIRFCKWDAKASLPKGTVYEIRTKSTPKKNRTANFGRSVITLEQQIQDWGICWYTILVPDGCDQIIEQEPLFENDISNPIELDGYNLIARLKV